MKINKLYSLSEFVDHIGYGGELGAIETLKLIHKYNKFLKQPLKREMFVNPNINSNGKVLLTKEAVEAWEEAEKKVIFDGWFPSQMVHTNVIDSDGCTEISFSGINKPFPTLCGSGKYVGTLKQFSESFIGELKLKNVTL